MSEKEVSIRDAVEAAYESTVEEAQVEDSPVERDIPEPIQEEQAVDHKEAVKEESVEIEDGEPVAPSNWSPEDVEAFNELDERGKKLYLKRNKEREASYTKKFQTLAEERRIAENFKKAIAPHEEHLRNLGVDPLIAFDKLISTEKLLRIGTPQQKAQALQQIMHDYGINFNLPQQQNDQQHQQQYSPETLSLLQKVQTLEQRQQIIERDRVERETESLVGQIQSFENAKDDKGQAKYPHFEELRLDMSKRLQAGMAQNLEQAYEQSFWANEDLRQEYINVQYNSRMKEADSLKKTVASKKAGFNVKGSGGSSVQEAPSENLAIRAIVKQAYERQEKRQRI